MHCFPRNIDLHAQVTPPQRASVRRLVEATLEDLDELAEGPDERERLQLTPEEWNEWEEQKEGLEEKRNRLRVVLKQRFEEWAVRPAARSLLAGLGEARSLQS